MNKCECEKVLGSYFPFWSRLSDEQKQRLCSNARYAKYGKDENIHGNGGGCTGAILVKSGQVRAFMMSDEGREITLYRLYPGNICMLSASCVIQAITFDVFVDAEEDSEVYIINPKVFSELCDENVYVENFALRTVTERFSDVMWSMQQILFMSFDKRLAVFLIDELAKTGGDTIHLTQEQIAKYMGSAREVVSRMLKYFAAEKLVTIIRGGVKVIDKSRLKKMTY